MKPSLHGLAVATLACACAAISNDAAGSVCAVTARHAPADARIHAAIAEARRQHQLFGGQTIERNGGMFRVGYDEAEWARPEGESVPTWERVATFWRALSDQDPPDLMTSAGWVARSEAEPPAPAAGTQDSRADVAIHEALLRASIVDIPWSAAFISYLMKTAGFTRDEFAFSDTHADYVQAAIATSDAEAAGRESAYAFRACDVATTHPRAGDLLCATRAGTAHIANLVALRAALAGRTTGEEFPMHCDLVVRSDEGGDAKIDTIGGNVIQSVTLSRMTLNANKVLSGAYFPSAGPRGDHLTRRPWVVLLQFRDSVDTR